MRALHGQPRATGQCHSQRLNAQRASFGLPSGRALVTLGSRSTCQPRGLVQLYAKGRLGDDLLDFVTAGPKMRRWYGQAERPSEADLEEEAMRRKEEEEEEDEIYEGEGDAIFVFDADSALGEQVTLQLILARADIRLLVKDTVAAKTAYGPYVNPVSVDASNPAALKQVLKGCGSVVCLGKPGALLATAKAAGVAHVLMLSAAGAESQGGFLSSLFDRELSELRDPGREQALAATGLRHTVVRVTGLRDAPGGQSTIQLVPLAGATAPCVRAGPVSREDLAAVVVQALLRPPQAGGRTFQVVTTPGSPPQEWGSVFADVTAQPTTSA